LLLALSSFRSFSRSHSPTFTNHLTKFSSKAMRTMVFHASCYKYVDPHPHPTLVNTPIHNAHDPACATPSNNYFSVLSILSIPGMVFFAPGCHVRRAPPSSTFHIRCSAFATSISSGLVRRGVSACTSSHIRFAPSTLISTLYHLSMPAFPYNMPRCFYHPAASASRCLNQHTKYQTSHTATRYMQIFPK
jgi:hypothetical protein